MLVALGAQKHPVSPRLSDAKTHGKNRITKNLITLGGHTLVVNTVIPPEHLQTAQWLLLSSVVGHINIGRKYLQAEETQE